MRLVTFRGIDGSEAAGALIQGDSLIVDLARAAPADPSMRSLQGLIEAGPAAWDAAREVIERARRSGDFVIATHTRQLLAPVPMPLQMRDFGCFAEHYVNCQEVKLRRRVAGAADPRKAYEAEVAAGALALPPDYLTRPRFYTCNRLSVVGPDTTVPWPEMSSRLDFELEFGIFIGLRTCDVSEEEASRSIFGYTLFNDLTMRDVQAAEARTGGKNKDFDCGNVMGPCIVTADELPNPYDLRCWAHVNGQVWCENTTATMSRSFEQVIAYMSRSQTLHPGEFFGSGTVGRGCGLEQDRYLEPGDRVVIGMAGIGELAVTIGERAAARSEEASA